MRKGNYSLPSPAGGRRVGDEGGSIVHSALTPSPSPASGRGEQVVTRKVIQQLLSNALHTLQIADIQSIDASTVHVIRNTRPGRGEYSSNLPLVLAKRYGRPARELASQLLNHLDACDAIMRCEIAGAGFINVYLSDAEKVRGIIEAVTQKEGYGLTPEVQKVFRVVQDALQAQNGLLAQDDQTLEAVYRAYSRINSVLNQLVQRGLHHDAALGFQSLERLETENEHHLTMLISCYPEVLEDTLANEEYSSLLTYLNAVATGMHRYYHSVTLICEQIPLRHARLCLLKAVRQVIHNGLTLMGFSALESM